jgi:hypothetical protein
MKKLLFIPLLTILTGFAVYAQDTIVTTKGEKIVCKIVRENSTTVIYTVGTGYNESEDYINMSDISVIKYEKQPAPVDTTPPRTSLGIGIGMDYGGFGGSLLVYLQRNLGIFGGTGYAIAGFGYNVGAKFRFITEKSTSKIQAYALVMYGYNTAIAITNATEYNKLFYGPTLGFGVDFNSRSRNSGYWSLAVVVPIRSEAVNNYIDDLKNNHGVTFKNTLLPIGISIGYRFNLD